ncbi:hypothetical protein Tco_1328539 [Tanacetum coccineum]
MRSSSSIRIVVVGGVLSSAVLTDTPAVVIGALAVVTGSAIVILILTLFAAIQIRFGGNEATKKTQKTLLKQMYKNFSALSTESLDSIFNRLQKIVSQLAILGENISQEDLNLKFLRSLPSDWNPVHAYYNGSCTSKDNEDPSWSTNFKTRRTQKTSSALEVL